MKNTLYIKIDANKKITNPHVYLQDIAELFCTDQNTLDKLRIIPIVDFNTQHTSQLILSILDINRLILQKEPELQIVSLGKEDLIITYQKQKASALFQHLKILFVCIAAFFGSAFSIMTFNCDADVKKLFEQIYTQITGELSTGFTLLEISYSLGIGIGVLLFFNHFGKKKFSTDPTPLEVQMSLYENNTNDTIIKKNPEKQT